MMFNGVDTAGSHEGRSHVTETGSGGDYSSLNMTSLNAGVVYDSLQPT